MIRSTRFGHRKRAHNRSGRRLPPIIAIVTLGAIAVLPIKADARGFFAIHFGLPLIIGPPVYYPVPVYYYPPPPPPPPAVCHEVQSTAVIDGRSQPVYGTACLQPDGTWRFVG